MSLKPTLVSSLDPQLAILCPRKLTHFFIPPKQMNLVAQNILAGVFNATSLLSQVGRAASQSKQILTSALKTYLQESAIRFQRPRAGDDQHNPKELLRPLLEDIVLYVNSEGKICYGLVTAILTKNRVTVKTNLFGKPTFLPMHSRLLNLLFRHSEWDQDVPSSSFSRPNSVDQKLKEAETLTI